jgi:hypothetical protein
MGHDFPLVGHDKLAEVLGQHLGIPARPARVFLPLEFVCPKGACGELGAQGPMSLLRTPGVLGKFGLHQLLCGRAVIFPSSR